MADVPIDFPVKFTVDYPDRPLDKVTTFFRIFAAIPIMIVLVLLIGVAFQGQDNGRCDNAWIDNGAYASYVVLPLILMILFRRKYPRWWFDWNLQLARFITRVVAYLALLRDEYPSTDDEQAVHLEVPYPDAATELNRWLPLVKWLLAIPHYIVLVFLMVAAIVAVIIAWFAILFTGRYPRGLFDFVVGVLRWGWRVKGYCILLVTDKYPPFSLAE